VRVLFLGVAGSAPYLNHSLPAIVIDENILLDCGEGVTQALDRAKILWNINYILITHTHADHVSGLLMLLWRYALEDRNEELVVMGPLGIRDFIDKMLKNTNSPIDRVLRYLKIKELSPPYEIGKIKVSKAAHTVYSLAFRVENVCYTGDTAPSDNIVKLARGSELLIHDSTFPPGKEEEAIKEGHSTPLQAARIACEARAKRLALFHIPFFFFKDEAFIENYLKKAREIFKGETFIPSEFYEIEI